jgi:hypothetical protein
VVRYSEEKKRHDRNFIGGQKGTILSPELVHKYTILPRTKLLVRSDFFYVKIEKQVADSCYSRHTCFEVQSKSVVSHVLPEPPESNLVPRMRVAILLQTYKGARVLPRPVKGKPIDECVGRMTKSCNVIFGCKEEAAAAANGSGGRKKCE